MDRLDLFFNTLATLMSLLFRQLVENTIKDLNTFFAKYKDGNNYEGSYNIFKGLALPHQIIPFTFFLVADRHTATLNMEPSVEDTVEDLNEIIDAVVDSVQEFPRIERFLFESVQNLSALYKNLVFKDEEIVVNCKTFVKEVIQANTYGPNL